MTTPSLLPSHTFTAEKQATQRLETVLQQEQALLSGEDNMEFLTIINTKSEIVAEMAALANQRHNILATAGFNPDENGMQLWLDQNGSEIDKQVWGALLVLAQSAKELNRVNGLLIGKQMAINHNILHILQGKPNNAIYGPDGQSSIKTSGRPLGIG